jgi:hypothetical protein
MDNLKTSVMNNTFILNTACIEHQQLIDLCQYLARIKKGMRVSVSDIEARPITGEWLLIAFMEGTELTFRLCGFDEMPEIMKSYDTLIAEDRYEFFGELTTGKYQFQ